MKKCTASNKNYAYYCFDEELSEELEPLIDLVENYLEGRDLSRHCVAPPPKGELKEGGQPSKEISLSNENSPLGGGVAESDGGGQNNSKWTITTIYSGRNRLLRVRKGDYDLVIKCFAIPKLFRQIYYGWGRNSKAKRSFQNSLYLESLEVGVAKARAFVEEHSSFGLLKRSYYISDWVDYTKNHIHSEMRGYSNPNGFLPALAQFIVQLHEMGIEHRDLSPGNVLYKYNAIEQTYSFSLVDVNRMRTYPYPLSPQISLKNMERLASNYSVSSQLAYYYAEARGWDIKETIQKLNALCDNFWLKRLPKLSIRLLRREQGLSIGEIEKLYKTYKRTKLKRQRTSDKEEKARLFAQEEELYRQYLADEDIRHSLRKKEHYSYQISKELRRP